MSSSFDNRDDILTRYNYERERRRRTMQGQPATNAPIPPMLSAHEQVGTPNVNPFQNNFTPNTNTMSMQQIAGQVAPQPQQPFLERMARGAASLPVGIAGLAEGLTTEPLSTLGSMGQAVGKHAAETAAIASDIPMNPVYGQRLALKGANAFGVPGIGGIEPQLQQLQEERKQAYTTNPILAPLDVAGLVGAGQATSMLSKIGRKSAVPKIIADAVAPDKPKVDVPEVVQEPIRSETPKVDLSSEKPQPTTAQEVVNNAKPLINQDAPAVAPNIPQQKVNQMNVRSQWSLESVYNRLSGDGGSQKVGQVELQRSDNGLEAYHAVTGSKLGDISFDGSVIPTKEKFRAQLENVVDYYEKQSKLMDVASELSRPNVRAEGLTDIALLAESNPEALRYVDKPTRDLIAISEKFKPMDEVIDSRAGKISTEPPKATPDAGATPAQSIKPTAPTAKVKEPWEMRPREWIKGVKAGDNEWSAMVDKHFSAIDEFNRDIDTPGTYAEKTMRGSHLAADPFQRKHPEHAYASVRSGLASDALIPRLSSHKSMVEQALKDGKPVPPEVLADYPDLAAKYGKQGGESIELGALGTPSALHSTMGAVGRVAEKSMIPIQYIAKKIDDFMEKKGLANPFGTPEIVLKNTGIVEAFRDATAKEHTFVAEQSLKLKEILGERVTNEKYLAEMFRHLDNPQARLNRTEQALRGWFDDMLNTVNEFRVKRGEEPINYREGYIPHIFDKAKELLDADQSIALPRKAQNRFANARVGAEGYEKDLIQALELYTRATARDMYINDALHTAIPAIEGLSKKGSKILHREVVTDPDGTTKYFNSYRLNNADMWSKRGYAEAFVREQLGLPTTGQRFLKQVGINPRTSQKWSNRATGLIYRNLLGAAIDTGVKNLSQITHTLAENGYAPTMRGIGRFLTPEGIKAARSEHLLKEFDAFLLTKDMPGVDKSKILKQFDDVVLSGPMRFTEFVNRGIAYHTALDDALKSGKAFAEAHDIALKAVRKTQFEYNKMGTSPFMRGPFTRPMAQFTTFPTKTSEMIFQWATEGATGRAKLLRYFATTGALVYGGKELGVELGNIFFDPTKTVDPDSKGGFELPISGRKVKVDLTRLGSTGFAPQGFVPTVTKPYKYISDLMEKDRTAKDRTVQAFRELAPGGRFGGKVYDVATGSEYRDERGRLIRKDTKSDAWLKLLGGRPSNQDIMRNKKEEIVKIEDEYYETRRKIIDTQLNGDIEDARQMIADFSKKYPYLASRLRKSLKQGRKDERKKKQMSSDERFMDNSMRQRIEQNL